MTLLDPRAKELKTIVDSQLKAAQALFSNGDYSNARNMLERVTESIAQWNQLLSLSRNSAGLWNQHDTEQTMQELGLAQTQKALVELKKEFDNLLSAGRKIREVFDGLHLHGHKVDLKFER